MHEEEVIPQIVSEKSVHCVENVFVIDMFRECTVQSVQHLLFVCMYSGFASTVSENDPLMSLSAQRVQHEKKSAE